MKRSSRISATYLLQRAKSAGPSFQYKPTTPISRSPFERQQSVALLLDENCPVHGSQGRSTFTLFVPDINHLGSTNSLHQNDDVIQQHERYDNHGNTNDFVSTNIKPFHNNPPLPQTQRDVVGNNIYFNRLSLMNGLNDLDDEQLGSLMLYRDALKQNLTTPNRAGGGLPRMHYGRAGGAWRHIKQTNNYSAANLLFIDGTVRVDDSFKYPIPNYGYPPMVRPQHAFAASSNHDLANAGTKSLDTMTWSATDELNRRPSISQYGNRYERHAKDNFSYWPTDLTYKKPRCRTGTTGTYKTWLGLSDSILKL